MAIVATSTVTAQSGGQFALTWFSISNGSGTSDGAQFAIEDVIGEPIVGAMDGGPFSISAPLANREVENLVLLYVGGDNSLRGEVEELVRKAQRGAVGANAVTYLLLDRPKAEHSYLYLLSKFDPGNCNLFGDRTCQGEKEPVYVEGRNMWRLSNSMGSPDTLTDFLQRTISRHSGAQKIILSMVGHGSGWSPDPAQGQPPEHSDQPGGLLWDENPGTYFSTFELGEALAEAHRQTGRKIDLLYLDACLMGMWEVAYEIKDSVNYLLAAESWSWTSFAYDQHLQDLHDSPSVAEIGRRWLENESAILERDGYAFTYSLLDLSQAELVNTALDGLVALLDPNDKTIAQALSAQICFDSDWNSQINDTDNYCDLYAFAQELKILYAENIAIVNAAQSVMNAVEQMVPDGNEKSRGGVAFDNLQNAQQWQWRTLGGISLYMPLRQDHANRRFYRDTAGVPLKASRDGTWDNFLEAYWNGDPPGLPDCEDDCLLPPRPITIPPKEVFLPLVAR